MTKYFSGYENLVIDTMQFVNGHYDTDSQKEIETLDRMMAMGKYKIVKLPEAETVAGKKKAV